MRIYEAQNTAHPIRVHALTQKPIRPEAALESILHTNPELILDEPLLIIGRQARLDSGVADLVTIDQFGNVVVIEVKIGRSGTGSASEETILSQPQTYAADLNTDYDALESLYQDYRTRLDDGEWEVAQANAPGGTLQSGFETMFGNELAEHEFNTEQRMVVVAEEITERTAANARFLLEQGLHFQCAEVQLYSPPGDSQTEHSIVASSLVVDYDLNRVRPKDRPSPTYPDLVAELVQPVFPELRGIVQAEVPNDVFPDGFDTRGPALESRHPEHPDGVIYYISPEPDNDRVTIGIHNMNELPEVGEKLHAATDAFEQAGLTVKDNSRYNVVWKRWSVETVSDVRDLQPEITKHYKRMVQLGHEVLVGDDGEQP